MAVSVDTYSSHRSTDPKMTGPASLFEVMQEVDNRIADGETARFQPMTTGFTPLDDILNGGLRPAELLVIGGASGVGKTVFGLQVARNMVSANPNATAMYICYEHDRTHLLSRLLCMESAEQGMLDGALTLRKLADVALRGRKDIGLVSQLQAMPRYAPVIAAMESYADRLILVKASGSTSTLTQIESWAHTLASSDSQSVLVVDYLQKIPVDHSALQLETETTTYLAQGLKGLAMVTGLRVITIAASDRVGLKSTRMRLSDLRGSSALQYEADIGLVLNNKFNIVSREHMVYNVSQADAMRNWVVMSVEKNRAGRNAVDMEYTLDAADFRFITDGGYVRDRLIDEKVTLA